MGCHHWFCLLSGVGSNGGPGMFHPLHNVEALASLLSERIAIQKFPGIPPDDELLEILRDALLKNFDGENKQSDRFPPYLVDWCEDEPEFVVIGHFDDSDPWKYDGLPNGADITVRTCSAATEWYTLEKLLDPEGHLVHQVTYLAPSQSSTAVMFRRCWMYLQAWIGPLPPRTAFPDQPHMSMEGELWEIIQSQPGEFDDIFSSNSHWYSAHPNIDYGPMKHCWGQYQDYLIGEDVQHNSAKLCLEDVPYTRDAICQGLRGIDLVPSLLADFQSWIFAHPGIWPMRLQETRSPVLTSFVQNGSLDSQSCCSFLALPTELILLILTKSSLVGVLQFSASSKKARAVVKDIFNQILREMVLYGVLSWLKPVPDVPNEVSNALTALKSWLPESTEYPLEAAEFPFASFVFSCFVDSPSMRNRRRLAGIVKQFEAMWVQYRRNGWTVNRWELEESDEE
ncbi:hypothetical protein DL96DRAFT_1126638 [Flagelloscypha sp. PMI_526]|nr:hypothetical protein DL96DRAFT_1126638 [Flagelloscypha sp. PMI_526]